MKIGRDQWDRSKEFEIEPAEAYVKWTKAINRLRAKGLKRYMNPLYLRVWDLLARSGLNRSPRAFKLVSGIVLMFGKLTDNHRDLNLGPDIKVYDFNT